MEEENKTIEQSQGNSSKPLYIVTGATGAMGKVIAKRLASQGKSLILASRDLDKGIKLAQELIGMTLNNDITAMHLDLSSFARVKAFVAELKDLKRPVAALINNSAVRILSKSTS